MFQNEYPDYLANKPLSSNEYLETKDGFAGKAAARVAKADEETIDLAYSPEISTRPIWPSQERKLLCHGRQNEVKLMVVRQLPVDEGKNDE